MSVFTSANPSPEVRSRWERIWADKTPRIERHTCPTCGARHSWVVGCGREIPGADPLPDPLPVVDVLRPLDCINCLLFAEGKTHEQVD